MNRPAVHHQNASLPELFDEEAPLLLIKLLDDGVELWPVQCGPRNLVDPVRPQAVVRGHILPGPTTARAPEVRSPTWTVPEAGRYVNPVAIL